MKTAISIPDDLFRAAEQAARRKGLTRSRLYAEAIRLYLASEGGSGVTEELDEIYASREAQVDPILARMQAGTVSREEW